MNIKFIFSAGLASTLLSGASAAVAGGYVAPAVQIEPVVVAPVPSGEWAGAYAGGSIGYTFGGDDEIGFDVTDEGDFSRATDLGSVDVKGATGGLHLGYRWQRDRWVFGPELGIEGGSIDASETVGVGGDSFEVESEINSLVSLVMKTGYIVRPQTLVYGTFGVTRGDFDYTLGDGDDSVTEGYNKTGIAAGLGVEQMINASTSVFAEYQYRHFEGTDVEFGGDGASAVTVATPSHSNIKLGVNFRF